MASDARNLTDPLHQRHEDQLEGASLGPVGPNAASLGALIDDAEAACNFLKALGHDGRLTILCHLTSGPKSVNELENLLESRQAVVSQQLARLRLEGLVSARREGQAIFYSLLDPKVKPTLETLADLFSRNALLR